MSLKGKTVSTALKLKTRNKFRDLEEVLENPEKSVEAGLRSILEFGKDSVYGRKYDFAYILEADTSEELYRRYSRLPIITYEDITEYIDRSIHGESDVLFKGKPIMYMITSGTTSKPKLLPVSPHYIRSITDMTNMTLVNFMNYSSDIFDGKIFAITGKAREDVTPDGTGIGSVSGYNREKMSELVKGIYSVPGEVFDVEDYDARYYLLMRFSIEEDVRLLITANPTTVNELLKNAEKNFDNYCNDIESGTIIGTLDMPEETRKILEEKLKPNPVRAAELRALKKENNIPLPRDYWPNMRVLCTWKCANTAYYIKEFYRAFSKNTKHIEFGYYASECKFGFPLDESDYSILFPHEYYIEFVKEEQLNETNPKTYRIHELIEGESYCVIISTKSGLYRYNMADIVVAGPKNRNTPTVKMLQKTSGIVSMTGEKLSERQFNIAVTRAAENTGKDISFFIGFANIEELNYDIYVEFDERDITGSGIRSFEDEIDKQLREMNVEYAAKRESLRLGRPVVHPLPENSFVKYKKALIEAKETRDNQFKMVSVNQNDVLKGIIEGIGKI